MLWGFVVAIVRQKTFSCGVLQFATTSSGCLSWTVTSTAQIGPALLGNYKVKPVPDGSCLI